jgi:flagellar biosynthesis/type III secretory pathway chaperone
MSDQTTPIARLHASVAEEVASVRSVLEILGRESSALAQRDPGLLLAISTAKAEAVARAAELGRQRQALLQEYPDISQAKLSAAIDELRELAATCRQQNEANGLMIRGQRRRIEGALNILRGGQPGLDIYGRDGAATQLTRLSREPLASY